VGEKTVNTRKVLLRITIVLAVVVAILWAFVQSGLLFKMFNSAMPAYDTEASNLLDKTEAQFFGSPGSRDQLIGISVASENVLMSVNTRPDKNSPFENSIELRSLYGELLWKRGLDEWRIGSLIAGDDFELILVQKRDENKKVREVGLLTLSSTDGDIVKSVSIHEWDKSFYPGEMHKAGDDRFIVLGAKYDDEIKSSYGIVINSEGEIIEDWILETSRLFEIADGFIGITEIGKSGFTNNLQKIDNYGNVIWESANFDTTFNAGVQGVAEQANGDLIVTGWNREASSGTVASISGTTGEILWNHGPGDGFVNWIYNPIPWKDNQFLICAQKSFSSSNYNVPFWESLCALIIDSEGNLVDHDAKIDMWMFPVVGGHRLSNNTILFAGIGSQNPDEMTKQFDVAWATLELPVTE
jgi:hypothetical protein